MRLNIQVSRAAFCLMTAVVFAGSLINPDTAAGQSPSRRVSDIRETPTVLAIRRVSPAVVNIHGQKTVRTTAAGMAGAQGPDSFRQVNGMGTGVVIDPRGYVITNYHVVEDVDNIQVTLANGETTTAEMVSARIRNDLALIKVHTDEPLPTIPRGISSDLMVGESVIAIGNAYGYVHTSTQGIISALHRDVPVNETQEYHDLIQISAGINPGNSGGPLLNIAGEMIGVNVAVRVGAQQIAFAIPIDQVIEVVTDMIEQHNESRLLTGLRASGGPRDGDGVTIANVSASSPAAREGLKPGDRVVRVGSQPINNRLDFALAMLDTTPGTPLQISIERSGQRFDLAVLGEHAGGEQQSVAESAWSVVGIQAKPVAEATMRRLNQRMKTPYRGGLYITKVRPGSPADKQGMIPGDVLLGIHGWQTATMKDLAGILEHPDMQRGPRAKFYLVRREQTLFGHLQLAAQTNSTLR
ncbi:putative periplasmic serine endoprotease DegP-like precursor [Rubripirellula lacrimiformis]|uniref:Putative periplasmic serine endoprotease DegP-like n=1 Tax=Rubripirellula lacrimiformis TaxID=1930273 RepID=A0A517N3E2_9BACT|nr:trypsin-like peptidase domain-containing protein [Rubripirellula lacrimiformis]QDT01655.1 putative periplasmic serine endoprotease DegP-like precursor [Rubripirellula lacrimiformis]